MVVKYEMRHENILRPYWRFENSGKLLHIKQECDKIRYSFFFFKILPSRLQCSGRMGVTQAKPSRQLKLSRSLGSRETKAGRVFKTEYLRGKSLHLEEILEVHGMFSLRYSARHWSVCKESTPKRHQRIKLFPDNCLITKLENMYRNIKLLNTQHSKIHNVWHPVRNY